MVASNKTRRLVCTVVRVAEKPQEAPKPFVRKPSALVPWADPYIAGLVRRLQREVRTERAAFAKPTHGSRESLELAMFDHRGASAWLSQSAVADLEPPSPTQDGDWDWSDLPRWTWDSQPAEGEA